jgi:RecB family exonuclease
MRKPTLSPTKITTYLACPVKYRWSYVDSRGKWYFRAHSYYSFGTTLHQVLQRLHDSGDPDVTDVEQVLAAYEESWIDAGYQSAEEMSEAYGEGRLIVQRHADELVRRPPSAATLFVEKQLRADLGKFVLVGRLDRVDEHPDGTLEIIDYKTCRDGITGEDVRRDLAMGCYQLLLKRKFPDRPVLASIVSLRTDESATASLSDQELAEFERDLVLLGEEILETEFVELFPSHKWICGGCDFLRLCKKDEDFLEALSNQPDLSEARGHA